MANDALNASPEALTLNDRLNALHQAGHQNLDPLTQVSLAQNGGSTQNMLTTADTYKLALNSTGNEPTKLIADPSLNAAPDKAQAALAQLHTSHGPIPFNANDIQGMQQTLQSKGYAKNLQPGTWNSAWQSEWNRAAYDKLTAPGAGNTDSFNLFKKVLGEFAPAQWASTVVHGVASYIHSLPGVARQVIADVGGELGNLSTTQNLIDSFNPFIGKDAAAKYDARQAGRTASIDNALGGNMKADQLTEQERAARAVQDLGNVANLILLKGVGGSAFKAAGAIKAGVAAATEEGGMSLGKALITKSLPAEFANTPRLTVINTLYHAATEEGGKATGLITSRLFPSPIAARIAPMLETLGDKEGMYFAAKNAIGQTMRIPLRAATQALYSKGLLAGLGLLGTSEAQRALNAKPTYDATQTQPYSGILGNALDTLGFIVGNSSAPLQGSDNVGQMVSKAHQLYSNALGPIGFDSVVRGALGIKLKDLVNGTSEAFVNDHFLGTKLNQYAASHAAQIAAEDTARANGMDRTSAEYEKLVQDYEHQIINSPEDLSNAVDSLVNNKHVWTQMMHNDFVHQYGLNIRRGKIGPKDQDAFFASLNDLHNGPYKYADTALHPDVRNYWHGNNTIRAVEDFRSAEIADEWGKNLPPYYPGKIQSGIATLSKDHLGFAPSGDALAKDTPYGRFIVGTEDSNKAGRSNANVYTLHHNISEDNPRIINLNKTDSGQMVSAALKDFARQDELGVIEQPRLVNKEKTAANKTQLEKNRASWNALMSNEENKNAYITKLKAQGLSDAEIQKKVDYEKKTRTSTTDNNFYPAEFQNLKKMVSKPENYSGQSMIDAYKKALKSANILDADQIKQRVSDFTSQLMDNNELTGMRYNHPTYGEQMLIRPGKAIGKLAKLPSDYSIDKYLPSYLAHSNINGAGVIGFARKDSPYSQGVLKMAKGYFAKLEKLGYGEDVKAAQSTLELEAISKQKAIPDLIGDAGRSAPVLPRINTKEFDPTNSELVALTNKMRNDLSTKFGYDLNKLTRLDPVQMASLMWRKSRDFASEAYFPTVKPEGMSQEVFNNVNKMRKEADANGWRPVLGTDIGHGYELSRVHPDILNQRTNLLRKAAMRLGIDPTKVSDVTVAATRRMNVVDEVNKVLGSKIQPILGDNADSIYSRLLQGAQSGIFRSGKLGKYVENRAITKALGDTSNMDYQDIKEKIDEARKAVESVNQKAHQIRDLSEKQMVKILTRSIDSKDITSNPIPGYTESDARRIARAVTIGYAKTPTSLVGLGKAEDFIRASGAMLANHTMSFMGKVPLAKNFKIGEGPLINTLSSLPNDLFRLRDKYRFDLNPIFSYRRLAKTNVKAALEGVPASINPGKAMEKLKITDKANAILERTMPEVYAKSKQLEPLEKMLVQNDIWDIYNPAHNMAWQAYHLADQGLSDAEIAQKLTKINTYGDRTPLERTVNTIFYPFSFNKTLYRNVGGYLLDNPGKALLADIGFNLYSQANQNNAVGSWLDKHAPLLKELQKLNAFEHGTGLGQMGGINAPYISEFMNLFGPQRIAPANAAEAVRQVGALIPALGELNTILFSPQVSTNTATFQGTGVETGKVAFWALKNLEQHAVDFVSGHKRDYYQPMMTDQAQVQEGAKFVTASKAQLANAITSGGVWPQSSSVPQILWGKKINSSSINTLAHAIYPAYDTTKALNIALNKNQQAADYVSLLQGTFRFDAYNSFRNDADSVIQKLHKTNNPSDIQSAVNPLRNYAIVLAEKDSQFAKFYKKFYESSLGPIEGFSK